jgi:hypothetical protein
MKYAGRILVGVYAGVVLLAALYAVTTEIYLRHPELEQLLPSFVLAFVTLPLSLILDPLSLAAPSLLYAPLAQIALLTLCGAVQASLLWWWASP